jgi:rare lipoprotein A (peptidoglycan hydrolase)
MSHAWYTCCYVLRPDGIPYSIPFPQGGHVMRTWLTVVELCGLLLKPLLKMADGGSSKIRQVALSSWYGTYHQGRQTASGERFSRRHLTAAHRSLPLGAKMKVTNLQTKQQVVVKINDRCPYRGGTRRIIDLSEAAAKPVV